MTRRSKSGMLRLRKESSNQLRSFDRLVGHTGVTSADFRPWELVALRRRIRTALGTAEASTAALAPGLDEVDASASQGMPFSPALALRQSAGPPLRLVQRPGACLQEVRASWGA